MEANVLAVNFLLVDELDYELYVRSAVVQGSVDVKRAILRGHLQSEKESTTSYPEVQLDFYKEQQVCDAKLTNLEDVGLLAFKDVKSNDFGKYMSVGLKSIK